MIFLAILLPACIAALVVWNYRNLRKRDALPDRSQAVRDAATWAMDSEEYIPAHDIIALGYQLAAIRAMPEREPGPVHW